MGTLFTESLPQFIETAGRIYESIAVGFENSKNVVLTKINALIAEINNIFRRARNGFVNIGRMLMEGIGEGITSRSAWLSNLVTSYVNAIKRSVEASLGIHSPSKVFAEIGGYMAEGMGVGFEKEMDSVRKQMEDSIPTSFDTEPSVNPAADVVNGIVSGLSSAMGTAGMQTVLLEVKLDSKTIAQAIFDPLRDVSKQRGVALG